MKPEDAGNIRLWEFKWHKMVMRLLEFYHNGTTTESMNAMNLSETNMQWRCRRIRRIHLPDFVPADAGVPAPDEITVGRPLSQEEIVCENAYLQRICMREAFGVWKKILDQLNMVKFFAARMPDSGF